MRRIVIASVVTAVSGAMAALAVLVVANTPASAVPCGTVIQGPQINPANGHAYLLLASDTWTASEAQAVCFGGHLATIDDAAEDAWVFSTFASGTRRPWIGLYDPSFLGTWPTGGAWISGAPVAYTNWAGGEPNGSGSYGQMVELGSGAATGKWNDVDVGGSSTNVVGVVELPFTLSVGGVAVQPDLAVLPSATASGPDSARGIVLGSVAGALAVAAGIGAAGWYARRRVA